MVEEAFSGRTTAMESQVPPDRIERATISPLLESHAPLDWAALMLGTNDVGPSYHPSAAEVAFGGATLSGPCRKTQAGPNPILGEVLIAVFTRMYGACTWEAPAREGKRRWSPYICSGTALG
jgi:hypothetical protein